MGIKQLWCNLLEKLETILSINFVCLKMCGIILQPIIPSLSGKLLDRLNIPMNNRSWIFENEIKWNNVDHKLNDIDGILFKRIVKN